LLLKEVSGSISNNGISFTYTTGDIADSSYLGYDIGIRFIGSNNSGVVDNVSVQKSSLAAPPAPSAFDTWLGGAGAGFNGDSNGDGISDGLAWVFGAGGPTSNTSSLAPTIDNSSEPAYMKFNYRRLDAANNDLSTVFTIEYGTTLGSWNTLGAPDGTNVIIQTHNDDYGVGVDRVEVKLKKSIYEANGKLFTRLKVERNP
jgi:hypothetical protein